ncbi:hypothetical protein PR048_018855 [Dryococelus australis]|uniref:Uncharacterized protein n=1 Tax=Dryococelus australis TaxID=614101 RepID=A0ABQ9H1U4_9NEOP|nr:hypothetical protein PR048_018855 [Dryococelus australis]
MRIVDSLHDQNFVTLDKRSKLARINAAKSSNEMSDRTAMVVEAVLVHIIVFGQRMKPIAAVLGCGNRVLIGLFLIAKWLPLIPPIGKKRKTASALETIHPLRFLKEYLWLYIPISLLASHHVDPGSIPSRVTPDPRMWESCRTMPLVGGFSPGSPVSPVFSFRLRSILTSIPSLALRTSKLIAREEERGRGKRLCRVSHLRRLHLERGANNSTMFKSRVPSRGDEEEKEGEEKEGEEEEEEDGVVPKTFPGQKAHSYRHQSCENFFLDSVGNGAAWPATVVNRGRGPDDVTCSIIEARCAIRAEETRLCNAVFSTRIATEYLNASLTGHSQQTGTPADVSNSTALCAIHKLDFKSAHFILNSLYLSMRVADERLQVDSRTTRILNACAHSSQTALHSSRE